MGTFGSVDGWIEERRSGLEAVETATEIVRRIRLRHPTSGLFQPADVQWWWRTSRTTDHVPQLVWSDDAGPVAAALLTDWGDETALDLLVPPGLAATGLAHLLDRGLAHAAGLGIADVVMEVGQDDHVRRTLLTARGFAVAEDGVVEAWIDASGRPAVTALPAGYRSLTRADDTSRPHHMTSRSGPDVERRLRQTSLYRADLDVVVVDETGEPAAYGLFWFDPVTSTGLVEPMRTEDPHRRRGLARHVLTTGLDLLARVGARRVAICFEPDNAAASALYLDVGFVPVARTDRFAGPTTGTPALT